MWSPRLTSRGPIEAPACLLVRRQAWSLRGSQAAAPLKRVAYDGDTIRCAVSAAHKPRPH